MEHDNENLDIREKLLRLPKIKADENFLKRLQIQIDLLESEERTRDVVEKGTVSGYFKNLFGARLVPALGISSVVVAAFLVYFVLADKKESVVNDMTGNKNQQTVITTEKPGTTTPQITSNEAPKTGETNSQNKTEENKSQNNSDDRTKDKLLTNNQEFPSSVSRSSDQNNVVTSNIKKNIADNISDERTNESLKQKISSSDTEQSGTTQEAPKNELALPNVKGMIKPEMKGGVTSPEKKKEEEKSDKKSDKKSENNTSTKDLMTESNSERTIREGGRGNTGTEKSQKNTKPKKKDVNTINDINKNGLESLRDKIAK